MAQAAELRLKKQSYHRSEDALIEHFLKSEDPLWEDMPLPSVADPEEEKPKISVGTLQGCSRFHG